MQTHDGSHRCHWSSYPCISYHHHGQLLTYTKHLMLYNLFSISPFCTVHGIIYIHTHMVLYRPYTEVYRPIQYPACISNSVYRVRHKNYPNTQTAITPKCVDFFCTKFCRLV